jgi:O-antigen/teichoic acid export membrane protein
VAGTALNSSVVLVLALRLVGPADTAVRSASMAFLRRAVPFGLVSFMTSVYFTIDLALLGWLVSGQQLGNYAAATKVLSLLIVLPGLLMNAALPGISGAVGDRDRLTALAARLAHWMAATGLPVCVAAGIFAPQVVTIVFGSRYDGAVVLARVLVIAAVLALASNIVGNILGAAGIVRQLLIQNAVAICFNVAGNLLLVPRYGVIASAWLTVATEAFVLSAAIVVLRHRVDLRQPVRAAVRPVLAVLVAAVVAVALSAHPLAAFLVSTAAFAAAVALLHAWPSELVPRRRAAAVEVARASAPNPTDS